MTAWYKGGPREGKSWKMIYLVFRNLEKYVRNMIRQFIRYGVGVRYDTFHCLPGGFPVLQAKSGRSNPWMVGS